MTRSRRDQLSRTGSGGTGDKTKKDDAVKKEKTKLSGSVKETAVGQSGDGAGGSTSKCSQDAIDIPSLLYDVERRVQKKQDFEKIAERMPLSNTAWTLMNIHKFVKTLSLKFTETHYLACGFSMTEIELYNKLRKDARDERKAASKKRSSSAKGDSASRSGSATKKDSGNTSGTAQRPVTARSGDTKSANVEKGDASGRSESDSLIKADDDDTPGVLQAMALAAVSGQQVATGSSENSALFTARTDVSANKMDTTGGVPTTSSGAKSTPAKPRMTLVPQGNTWVVQDEQGRSFPVIMEDVQASLVTETPTVSSGGPPKQETLSMVGRVPRPVTSTPKSAPATTTKTRTKSADAIPATASQPDDTGDMDTTDWAATTLGLTSSSPLTNTAPKDYVLPRDHPWATDILTVAEAALPTAWQRVWRDDELFEELGPLDAEVLLKMDGDCHFFDSDGDGSTVNGGCGHVCKGRDYHWLCRTCQLLTTRELCCYKLGNLCALGEQYKREDKALLKSVISRRKNYNNGVWNRGWPVKMVWLGKHPELRHCAVGRIAYAVGAGATSLKAWLTTLEMMARELQIEDVKGKIQRWKALGEKEGPGHRCPRTQYKITPVFAKSPGKYLEWLGGQKGSVVTALAEKPPATMTTRTASSRRKPEGFYKDTSDISDTLSQPTPPKRGLLDAASDMTVRTKCRRSGLVSPNRRTPTPVRLFQSELNVIDDALVMRTPVSDAELYRGSKLPPRLQLSANSDLVDETIARLQTSVHDPAAAALAAQGVMPVHSEVERLMSKGDYRRRQEMERYDDVPPTASWGLLTPSAYSFDEPSSRFRVAPTRLPQRHLAGTADLVESSTFLPTTHAALCGSEELGRAAVLNASLLMHVIDDSETQVMELVNHNLRAVTQVTDDVTATQQTAKVREEAKEAARKVWAATSDAFMRLRGAARRMAATAVDVQQIAVYHRRWSLLQGAEQDAMMRLLMDNSGLDVNNILDVRRPHNAPTADVQPEHKRFTDSEAEAASAAGTCDEAGATVPASPLKLTLSDVESVLGVLKNVVATPKSTTSSLSKIVNQVSGHVVSDFLASFQNGEGEGQLPTSPLNRLNLS